MKFLMPNKNSGAVAGRTPEFIAMMRVGVRHKSASARVGCEEGALCTGG